MIHVEGVMTPRPTIPMTPDWIAQAKASAEQLDEAWRIAIDTLALKGQAYTELCDQRASALRAINRTSPLERAAQELELLTLQARVVVACQEWQTALRISKDLRHARAGA